MSFLNGGFFALIVLALVDLSVGTCTEPFRGRDVLDKVPLIDGNNALPYNIYHKLDGNLTDFHFDSNLANDPSWGSAACPTCHTDLPRMLDGKIGGQFWVVNTDCEAGTGSSIQPALEQIDIIKRLIRKYPNKLQLVTNASDIELVRKRGKIASMIAIEGGHTLAGRLAMLRMYYDLGVRYMTWKYTCKTPWSHVSSSVNDGPDGEYVIYEYGEAMVLEMNRLGIIVDLTHTTYNVVRSILGLTRAPIIFSHSSAYAICRDDQNIPDDVLLSVKNNNGIVMVSFTDEYVNCDKTRKATIEDVVGHINYIRRLIGVDHVGIGAHYDGTSTVPQGLEDVSKYPVLFDRLYNRRENEPIWSAEDLEKLAGRNLIRVFRAVEAVRDCLASESPWEGILSGKEIMRPVECQIANKWVDIRRRSNIPEDAVPSRRQMRRFIVASKPKARSMPASKPQHRQVEGSIEK